MLRILLIDDCFPINARNRKILGSLAKHYGDNAELAVMTWDRNNGYTEEQKGYHVYKKDSAYGHKTLKLINLWGYRQFCHANIKALSPDVIFASHWNNLLLVPRLNRKKQMLIYENLDVPTGPCLPRMAATAAERLKMRRADLTIHASRFFAELYPAQTRQVILENKPTFEAATPQPPTFQLPIRIAFIGLLRHRQTCKALIDAVSGDSRFQLFFHGDGHARQFLETCAKEAPNVHFTGAYAYEDVGKLYQQTDIVWAAYPNKDFNVRYAISNKFHESMAFSVPAIYADNTCLGRFAVAHHIGMAVDPYSAEAIKALLNSIADNRDKLSQMSSAMTAYSNSQTTWEQDFKQVTDAIDRFFRP